MPDGELRTVNEKFDKQKLLDLMGAEYDFAERTLMLVPEDLIEQPNVEGYWSVKDIVAHLSAWHRRVLRWLEDARQGNGVAGQHPVEPESGFTWDDFDAIDTMSYERDKNRPWDDILADFHWTFEALYKETEELTEAELFSKSGLSLFFRDPIWGYIAYNTFFHYQMHIEPVRAWLRDIAKFQTAETRTYSE
jgi:hypothetical protein